MKAKQGACNLTNELLSNQTIFFFFFCALKLSTMFLVGSIKSVAAQMFPNKQIHVDPEDCPTIVELLPLKQKEQIIKTETRKQKGESQNNQLLKESAAATKSTKTCPTSPEKAANCVNA